MKYVDILEIDSSNPKYKSFFHEVMIELGFFCILYKNKSYYYKICKRDFAKLKIKYSEDELIYALRNNEVGIGHIDRSSPTVVKIGIKYGFNVKKLKKGTRYYIKRDDLYCIERIITENDIQWDIA